MDERLLERLDATDEVRQDGRSAVLRRAVAAYLRRSEHASIRARYERAYPGDDRLAKELAGWDDQGVWPDA